MAHAGPNLLRRGYNNFMRQKRSAETIHAHAAVGKNTKIATESRTVVSYQPYEEL